MIAIIKGCGNNIASLEYAIQRLGYQFIETNDINIIRNAPCVILPGVGHTKAAMDNLRNNNLDSVIPELKQPVLGICLGMQLLFDCLEEGDCQGLQIIPGDIAKLESSCVPHMGWNRVYQLGQKQFNYYYFAHSYYAPPGLNTSASANMGTEISAIVKKDNFIGMQFHPEKSGQAGSDLFKQFIEGKLT